jgi:uncharacterized protein Usg
MRAKALPILSSRLTTAEILYHLPDHPHVIQSFIWQQMDLAPDFPALRRFLDFWIRGIEGKLHSVKIAQTPLVARSELRHANYSLTLH